MLQALYAGGDQPPRRVVDYSLERRAEFLTWELRLRFSNGFVVRCVLPEVALNWLQRDSWTPGPLDLDVFNDIYDKLYEAHVVGLMERYHYASASVVAAGGWGPSGNGAGGAGDRLGASGVFGGGGGGGYAGYHGDMVVIDDIGTLGPGFYGAFTHGRAEEEISAVERGEKLLQENLTPAQRETLKAKGYFEVRGGETGKRYRIYRGRQMNVIEIGMFGRKRGLCFLPRGGLVEGDIMLGQKLALELNEMAARASANPFTPPARLL